MPVMTTAQLTRERFVVVERPMSDAMASILPPDLHGPRHVVIDMLECRPAPFGQHGSPSGAAADCARRNARHDVLRRRDAARLAGVGW